MKGHQEAVRLLQEADVVCDADCVQREVKRIAAGLKLDDPVAPPPSTPPRAAQPAKERPATSIVPPMPQRPVTQE